MGAGGRATLQHLQVLQSARPLDPTPPCLGVAAELPLNPRELFSALSSAEAGTQTIEQLREAVKTAEFWISLLEGENCDLLEEVSKQKQRHQLALRQVDGKSSQVRELEGERRGLQAQIKQLQESRDKAICERATLREDSVKLSSRAKSDLEMMASKAEALELDLRRELAEKAKMEGELS